MPTDSDFAALDSLAAECHGVAIDKGWYQQPRQAPELLMLVVSELAEALEEFRSPPLGGECAINFEAGGKPTGIPIELADAIIRILDMCGYYGIPIGEAVRVKMAYNQTRPYRHGGKKF